MTALSPITHFNMDFLQAEDTMDLASSPHMLPDDLELELDVMHEEPLENEDTMIDDHLDSGEFKERPPHSQGPDDHEMVDEDTAAHIMPDRVSDLNMEASQQDNEQVFEDKDEDILYEDDDFQKEIDSRDYPQEAAQSGDREQEGANEILDDMQDDEGAQNQDTLPFSESVTTTDAVGESTSIANDSTSETVPQEDIQHSEKTETEHVSMATDSDQTKQTHPEQSFSMEDQANIKVDPNTGQNGLDLATSTNHSAPSAQLSEVEQPDSAATQQSNTFGEDIHSHFEQFSTQDVAIHPVTVIYQDSEISLFPAQHTDDGETFFLSDTTLAYGSLDKLLASCRDVLADTIGDDDELVLDVASMGLHISEGSRYAAEITLTQILDVYLALSHNDNLEQIEPLYCSLSSRVCLASQYAYLTTAAQEGKSFTEISTEHLGTSEENEYEQQGGLEYSAEDTSDQKDPTQAASTETGNAPDELTSAHDAGYEIPHANDGNAEIYAEPTKESENQEAPISEEAPDRERAPSEVHLDDHHGEESEKQDAVLQAVSVPVEENAKPDSENDENTSNVLEEPETESAAAESASSHTVEADYAALEEPLEKQEKALEDEVEFELDKDHEALETHEYAGHGEEQQHYQLEPANQNPSHHNDSDLENDEEDDLLDFEAEDDDQPQIKEVPAAQTPVEEDATEDFDVQEDLFAEVNASPEQTVTKTKSEKANGHLNAAIPPSTPSTGTRSKRKVADEDDGFGLLETATPEKKRQRPF